MKSPGAPISDARRNLRQIAYSPVCWTWVAVIFGLQAIVSVSGGHEREPALGWFTTFGLSRYSLMEGKFWQLVTYGLFHGGWLHVGVNSLCLLLVGSRVEHMAGRAAVWKTSILGILGGGVFHILLTPGGASAHVLVGLSGGCVGLLLLLTTLSPESRMLPVPVSGRSLGAGILAAELILAVIDPALGLPVLAGLGKWLSVRGMESWFQIGHACHFGGGLAGWSIGRWMLRPRVTLERLRHERARREARGSVSSGNQR